MKNWFRMTSWAGVLYVVEEIKTGEVLFSSVDGSKAYDIMTIANDLRVGVEN